MLINLNRIIIFFMLLFIEATSAQAVPLWYNIQPLPQAGQLNSVSCSNVECVAVGVGGTSINIRANASMALGEPYSSASLASVVYNNQGEFFVITDNGYNDPYADVLKSKNGYRWANTGGRIYMPGQGISISQVIYTGTNYFAVGFYFAVPKQIIPLIARSSDGLSWTNVLTSGPLNQRFKGIAQDPVTNKLVAVTDNSLGADIYTSVDNGASWLRETTAVSAPLSAVIWDNTFNQFVAVGESGTIIVSSDGATWTDYSIVGGSNIRFTSLAVNPSGLIVAVSKSGRIVSSLDGGVNWSDGVNVTENFRSVTWAGNKFLAVGYSGAIKVSFDGLLWFSWDFVEPNPVTYAGLAFDAGNNRAVAAGTKGQLDYSLDSGSSWTKGYVPASDANISFRAATWVPSLGTFVAVGGDYSTYPVKGIVKFSTTGQAWSKVTTKFLLNAVGHNEPAPGITRLVAVGASQDVYTSVDGASWTLQTGALSTYKNGVAGQVTSPYSFVAIGSSTIEHSVDAGATWANIVSPVTGSIRFNDIIWSSHYQRFFIVGERTTYAPSYTKDGILLYSAVNDGSMWFDGTAALAGVAAGKKFLSLAEASTGLVIAGGGINYADPGFILESTFVDGFSLWTQPITPSSPTLNSVTGTPQGGAIAAGNLSSIIAKLDDIQPPSQVVAPDNLFLDAVDATPIPLTDSRIQAWLQLFYASDNRDITILDIQSNAPATFAPNTTTPITFTARDRAGNVTPVGVQRNIVVQDSVAPNVTAPPNISVLATSALGTEYGNELIQAFLNGATATDNVDAMVVVYNDAPTVFPIGKTKVDFFADDSAGNRSFALATVEVTSGTGGASEPATCLLPQSDKPWVLLSIVVMLLGVRRAANLYHANT